jgi:hypothetical protein
VSIVRRHHLLAVLAAAVLLPAAAAAQDEYLFSNGPREFGGYGGPLYRVTTVAGETVSLGGGGGAALFNRRFAVGGMGVGGTTSVDAIIGGSPVRGEMDFGYGGLTLEYITRPSKLVHATVGVLLGGGGVSVWPDDSRPRDPSDNTEYFGVVEPSLGLEVNVIRWMRIGVVGSYRVVTGANEPKLVNRDLDGASASLLFRFGKF